MDFDSLTPEALQALDPNEFIEAVKEKAREAKELAEEKERILKKRDQLIADNKKYKAVNRLTSELGVDLKADGAEDQLANLLAKIKAAQEDAEDDNLKPASSSTEDPAGKAPKQSDSQLEHQRAMKRLQTEMETLRAKLEAAELEKQEQARKTEEIMLKNLVVKEMVDAGCDIPEHLWLLTKSKYHLDKTDPSNPVAVGGDEYDPVPIATILGNLRATPEFKRYFSGSGSSGSGMTQSQGGPSSMQNPFRSDYLNENGQKAANLTKAAEIMQKNPEMGKRLLGEAAAAGKLDPVLARTFKSM